MEPTDQETNNQHFSLHLDNFPDQSNSNSLSPKVLDSQDALDPQSTNNLADDQANPYPSTSEISNIIPLRSLPSTHCMLNSKTSTQIPSSQQYLFDSLDFEIDPSKDSRQDFHHPTKPSIFKSQHHEKLRKLKKAASQDLDVPFPDSSPSCGQQMAQSQKIFFPEESDQNYENFQFEQPQQPKKSLQPQKSWTHLSVVAKALSKFKPHQGRTTALNSRQFELLHELNPEQRKGSKIITKGFSHEISLHRPEGRCWFFRKGLPRKEKIALLKQQLKEPINPSGKFRFGWDIIVMLVVIADMVVLPLQISFGVLDISNKFNYFCLGIFVLDIFFNFHTAYYKHGNLITSHAQIAKRYLKSWFIIDFLAAFPFFLFAGNIDINDDSLVNQRQRLLTALRLVKIFRLFRLFKLRPILYKFRIFFGSTKTQGPYELIRLLIVALVFAHWLACSWHLLAVYEIEYIHTATTWLEEKGLLDADAYTRYLYSLYWAIATMLTVGYGDIVPVTTAELWFTIVAMLIGCGIFAYVLSTIGNIIREYYQERAKLRSSIHTINRFMNRNPMSKDVKTKVQGYIEYLLEEESHKKRDQEEFLGIMPESIKRQVLIDLNGRLLTHHVIFSSNFNVAFLVDLATKLKERVLGPEEEIFNENEREDNFYFVVKGKIELYIDRTRQVIKTMGTGDYFGEIPFFSNSPKTLSAISCFYSHVFYLKKKTFLKRLLKHPSQRESYCYMKDQIDLYKDYSSVKTKCFACDDPHHIISECSQVLYIPDYQNIIRKINQEEQSFMRNFVRKPIRRFHALGHQPEIVDGIEKIQENSSITLPFSRMFIQRNSSLNNTAVKRRRSRSRDSFNRSPSPEAIKEIPSRLEDEIEFSKNAEILKLDELSDVYNTDSEEERDEEWRLRRRQKKKEFIGFDSVKIFNKYFPHNNVDNIIKRLNRLNEIHKLTPQNDSKPGPKQRKSILVFLGKKQALKNPFPSLANLDDMIPELPESKSGSDKQVSLRIDSKLGPSITHHKSHHPPLTAKLGENVGEKSAEDSPKSAATELGRVYLPKP